MVPGEKLQCLTDQLRHLQEQGQAIPKVLASNADTLMSFEPGMPSAPLYNRGNRLQSRLSQTILGRTEVTEL